MYECVNCKAAVFTAPAKWVAAKFEIPLLCGTCERAEEAPEVAAIRRYLAALDEVTRIAGSTSLRGDRKTEATRKARSKLFDAEQALREVVRR